MCLQNVANTWRQNGYSALLHFLRQVIGGTELHRITTAVVFKEPIDWSADASEPKPSELIRTRAQRSSEFIATHCEASAECSRRADRGGDGRSAQRRDGPGARRRAATTNKQSESMSTWRTSEKPKSLLRGLLQLSTTCNQPHSFIPPMSSACASASLCRLPSTCWLPTTALIAAGRVCGE